MRLRTLTILFLSAFLVATAATGIAIHLVTRATIDNLVDRRIAAASRMVAGTSPSSAAEMLGRIDQRRHDRDTGDIGFVLTGAGGTAIGGNVAPVRALPIGYSDLRIDDRIKGLTAGRALVRDVGNGMRLTTIAETEPFDDHDAARTRIYLIGFGSIVLIVVAGALAFGLMVRRRIAAMRRTVEAIIDGDMRSRVPVRDSGGEFDQQALAFNRMLDRIAALMASIANVSSDVAHDLRTPLARLRSQIAMLAQDADTDAMGGALTAALAQCDALLAMFAAMLRITDLEDEGRRAAFAPIDLDALTGEVVEMMQPVAEDAGHCIAALAGGPARIMGDRQLLTQALLNLIDNALRHTPAGTGITVATGHRGAMAVLSVSDDGPGIAPEDRAEAMRRFGRLDPSRHDAGHGLGLPLVQAIARLHRGDLVLEDAAPGLRVVVTIPPVPRPSFLEKPTGGAAGGSVRPGPDADPIGSNPTRRSS